MFKKNDTLPPQVRDLLKGLSMTQAVPLGDKEGLPLVLVKVTEDDIVMLGKAEIPCEMNPTILTVTFENHVLGLCFMQLRLSHSDEHIYTVRFDLHNPHQFDDANALLSGSNYGVVIASEQEYTIIEVPHKTYDFKPHDILMQTQALANTSDIDIIERITYAITQEATSIAGLWEHLETIAPLKNQWYASLHIDT